MFLFLILKYRKIIIKIYYFLKYKVLIFIIKFFEMHVTLSLSLSLKSTFFMFERIIQAEITKCNYESYFIFTFVNIFISIIS
jgi:hypothetical protein